MTATGLLDTLCSRHSHEIQVKAVSGVASDRLTAAAYAAMAERLAVGSLPDYLVVSYDVLRATVVLAEFFDGDSIDASRPRENGAWTYGAASRMDRCLDLLPGSSGESWLDRRSSRNSGSGKAYMLIGPGSASFSSPSSIFGLSGSGSIGGSLGFTVFAVRSMSAPMRSLRSHSPIPGCYPITVTLPFGECGGSSTRAASLPDFIRIDADLWRYCWRA